MLKILLPVDGSQSSRRAVEYVARLPNRGRPVTVNVLNVQPPISFGELLGHTTRDDQIKLEQAREDAGRRVVDQAVATLRANQIEANSLVRIGDAASEIVQFARESRCEEIVMGRRGLGVIKSLLLGSVANKVLHLADEPVVLVR